MAEAADVPASRASDLVTRGLLGGLGHGLNGRLAALAGIAHVARGGGLDAELRDMLSGEVERLGELTSLLRALSDPPREPEAIALGEAVREAVSLHALQRGLEMVPVEFAAAGDPVVRVQRVALRNLLLLLMMGAGREALAGGRRVAVRVAEAAGGAVVAIGIEPAGGPRQPQMPPPQLPADFAEAAAALAAAVGGELSGIAAGQLELRLPVLTAQPEAEV